MHHSRASATFISTWQRSLHSEWRRPSNATQLGQPPKELDLSWRLLIDCPLDLLVELGIAKLINSSWVGDINQFSDILFSKRNNTLLIHLFIGFTMRITQGRFYTVILNWGKLLFRTYIQYLVKNSWIYFYEFWGISSMGSVLGRYRYFTILGT